MLIKMKKFFLCLVFATGMILVVNPGMLEAKSLLHSKSELAGMTSMAPELTSAPQDKDLGIGPVKTVELGPINAKMVEEGKTIFTNQCVICHDVAVNKLGPALKGVTKTRTPQFIMNLLLNPAQMQKDNETIKALLKQYNNLPMPDPALNQAKARSVLEYLRSLAK